ncbi:MAG: hypothetical protein FWC65_06115 [Treponema sp.]|nr:hypothetical protein [Treponema sp.]
MSDKNLQPVVSRSALVKQGMSALACLAGGVIFLVMAIVAPGVLFGIILPAAALVVGVGSLLSRDAEGRKPGLILAAAGMLGLVLRFVRIPPAQALAGTVLAIGAFGLLAAGVWKGIQFLRGLKTRQ